MGYVYTWKMVEKIKIQEGIIGADFYFVGTLGIAQTKRLKELLSIGKQRGFSEDERDELIKYEKILSDRRIKGAQNMHNWIEKTDCPPNDYELQILAGDPTLDQYYDKLRKKNKSKYKITAEAEVI